jgi:hypothetical protein
VKDKTKRKRLMTLEWDLAHLWIPSIFKLWLARGKIIDQVQLFLFITASMMVSKMHKNVSMLARKNITNCLLR